MKISRWIIISVHWVVENFFHKLPHVQQSYKMRWEIFWIESKRINEMEIKLQFFHFCHSFYNSLYFPIFFLILVNFAISIYLFYDLWIFILTALYVKYIWFVSNYKRFENYFGSINLLQQLSLFFYYYYFDNAIILL